MTEYDDYRRQIDLIFQEMGDREQLANQEEIRENCRQHGGTDSAVDAVVRDLEKIARSNGKKTTAETNAWAWAVLGECRRRSIQIQGLNLK